MALYSLNPSSAFPAQGPIPGTDYGSSGSYSPPFPRESLQTSSRGFGPWRTTMSSSPSRSADIMYHKNQSEPFSDSGLPFGPNTIYAFLTDAKMRPIKPRIFVNCPVGFFQAGGIWTCYRRNYFMARCHFELEPSPHETLYLMEDQLLLRVGNFHVTLTAKLMTDRESTKIGLRQRAPRADKGPLPEPEPGFYELAPSNDEQLSPSSREHVFERIQFESATANNGRRRAVQQFFHLVLELWCDVIGRDRLKIAERVSEPVVVRGRSPGHYSGKIHLHPSQGQRYPHADDNYLPPQSYGLTFLSQPPVDPQQQEHVISEANLEGILTESAETNRILAGRDNQGLGMRQNDLENTAEREQPQLGTDSVTAEVQNFDTSSMSSASDVFSRNSMVTGATSSDGSPDLANVVVSMLLRDQGIKNVCIDGFSRLDPDRFERHLRRTLKAFAKNLIHESSRNPSKYLGYFLRRQVAELARSIREQAQALEGLESFHDQINHVPKEIFVQQYSDEMGHDSDFDLSNSDYGSNNDEEEFTFTSVCAEAIENNSFEVLREDLLDFVVPFMLNGVTDGQVLQELQTRYSYKIPGNTHAAAQPSKKGLLAISRVAWLLVSGWFEYYVAKLELALSKFKRPRVIAGHVRRKFTCECGETISWVSKKGSGDEHGAPEDYSSHSNDQQHSPASGAPPTTQQAVPGGVRSVTGIWGVLEHSATPTVVQRPNIAHGSLTHRSLQSSDARYLELCINTDQYEIILEEINISAANAIHTDGQLFREIRRRYDQARSKLFAHRSRLFKPKSVNYVQFCVSDELVGILQSPRAIPPDSQDYDFHPCPMMDPPPVPESIFLHLLTSKRPHYRDIWLSRLPKKRHTSILPPTSTVHQGTNYVTGWGVHINESPNGETIFRITVISVLINLTLALIYTAVSRGDVQSGFAIGAFLVAGESAITFAYFHYHSAANSGKNQ